VGEASGYAVNIFFAPYPIWNQTTAELPARADNSIDAILPLNCAPKYDPLD